jgi:hypothetical protein
VSSAFYPFPLPRSSRRGVDARREKDLAFNGALARRGIVAQKRLRALLEKTPVAEAVCERIRRDIARDFDGQTSPDGK